MSKYLSVITNFGCHYTCPYCIVKENNLHIPKTTIEGLKNLTAVIEENGCNWVSLSGGGDPLYHYIDNAKWFRAFFDKIPPDVKLELHTSYYHSSPYMVRSYDRVVYHLRNASSIEGVRRVGDQIIRVVFVVT